MSSVSLVIAAYNRGPKIAPILESALAQSVPPGEILVVDDGSPDGTGAWVAEHYPMVRVVRIANRGTSGARNFGASEARGEVLVFLDHDDLLRPHAVETLLRQLATFPEARASFADHAYTNTVTGVRYHDHHGDQAAFHRLRAIPVQARVGLARLYGKPMHAALLRGNLLQQPWAVYRETFLRLGGFESTISYCEDWDLYLRVAAAVPLVLSDEVISEHMIEGENLHLAPGQAAMHRRVICRQLQFNFPKNPRALAVLCRRLAMYHKSEGDRVRPESPADAWKSYLKSLAWWPFDHVVLARVILWASPAWFARSARASGRTAESGHHAS
jgi:glycosyltransferase involved in cell wall biosynthesis